MAPPLINELFEKAILEVTVLHNAADGTGELLDQILESGEEIRGFATNKGENAQGALSGLIQAAARIQQELDQLVTPRTRTALEAVETAAATLCERTKALLVQANGRAEDLEQQRARLDAELEANRKAMHTSFEHIGQTVQALGAEVAEQAAAAQNAVATLRQGVNDARVELNAAKGRFLQALADAEEAVDSETGYYRDSVSSLRKEQTEGLVGLANTMVDAHNLTLVDLRQRLVDEVPAELWRAIGSLKADLDELDKIRQDTETPLDTTTAAIQATVKDALEALAKVRTFAEEAKDL